MNSTATRAVYSSGECDIDLAQREVRVLGCPVPVGGRAFEIIETLVLSAGKLLTKDEIMHRVWPGAIVMDGTLHVHVAAVRKALGPYRGLLKTESCRGYRLLGDWAVRRHDAAGCPIGSHQIPVAGKPPATNLPEAGSRLIGRSFAVEKLCDLLSAYRVVTLTGTGGIGKTKLALEVARRAAADHAGGGWLVELASLSDPSLVPTAVAHVLGIRLTGGRVTTEGMARAIAGRQLLLVLDNCEHVIEAAAHLANSVIRLSPHVTILATSRESLRIEGEHVYRLPPLDVPVPDQNDPLDIRSHSAVELFITRATELNSQFSPHAENLPIIAEICRRLDGIPLAIQFAAARAATLGVQEVATGLADRFRLLTNRSRAALPRHRTLRATLDWSHDLLPPSEQIILRRLAIFQGDFTMNAGVAVAIDGQTTTADAFDGIANLIAKSLIATDISGNISYCRLLDTARAYTLDKLIASGDLRSTALRHAEYYRDLLAADAADLATEGNQRIDYARMVDDIRAALAWSFGPDGDIAVATALAAVSAPAWLELGLPAECSQQMATALARLDPIDRGTRRELVLVAALGSSLDSSRTFTKGMASEVHTVLLKAADLAERLEEPKYQLQTLVSLFWSCRRRPDCWHGALEIGLRCEALAARVTDPLARSAADWMLGMSFYARGDLTNARAHLTRVCDSNSPILQRAGMVRFGFDQRIFALGLLGLTRWTEGAPEQAIRHVSVAIAEAEQLGHPVSLAHALWTGCHVALWVGDVEALERWTASLLKRTKRHSVDRYYAFGLSFAGELSALRGEIDGGMRLIRAGLDVLPRHEGNTYYWVFLVSLARLTAASGKVTDGLTLINEALEGLGRNGCTVFTPEFLRIKAELLLLLGDAAGAADHLARALAMARGQGALSWELRTAMSLQRLHGDDRSACERVGSVYQRFTEGFETTDLRAARRLLACTAQAARMSREDPSGR
jgi:predicted ATPase/DNA-binding winged helix-turn-helix (wHTH) protein